MGDENNGTSLRLANPSVIGISDCIWRQNLSHLPLSTQVGDQCSRMVVEVLGAKIRSAVGICVIAPAENPNIWNVLREEISQPEDVVGCSPTLFAMSIQ